MPAEATRLRITPAIRRGSKANRARARRPTGPRRRVDDEHDRRAEQPGDVRGAERSLTAPSPGPPPVEQAHHALDDRDVRAAGAVREQRRDLVLADQPRVEVAAGRPVASAW